MNHVLLKGCCQMNETGEQMSSRCPDVTLALGVAISLNRINAWNWRLWTLSPSVHTAWFLTGLFHIILYHISCILCFECIYIHLQNVVRQTKASRLFVKIMNQSPLAMRPHFLERIQTTSPPEKLFIMYGHELQRAPNAPETELIKVEADIIVSTCFVNTCTLSFAATPCCFLLCQSM